MSNFDDGFDMHDLPAAAAALSAEDRAGLVNALKSKLQSLADQHKGHLESLSPEVKKRIEVLKKIQGQHDELEAKFFEEKAALEAKYEKLYEPLYIRRCEIVKGVEEVEVVANEGLKDQEGDKATEEKGVPEFWLTAMKNNEVLVEEITERDEGALKYLVDIKWCKTDDPKGFKLDFHFDHNPYFKNSVLTKTYQMIDGDEPLVEKATGTEIEWYPGKCLTRKLLKKKPKVGSKNAKPIIKAEDCESFFNFFKPHRFSEVDDDDIDEDIFDGLQTQMEQDYNIGSTIRDKIIPHAVSWFTGEAIQENELGGVEDDDDDDNYEDSDEHDEDAGDDEDKDEDNESKGKKKSVGPKKNKREQASEGQSGERLPECKQQ